MKKATITLALLFATLIGFSQNKTAKGQVLIETYKHPITNAAIKVKDTSIISYTDDAGKFSIEVPQSFKRITISHKDFIQKKYTLKPGFQSRPLIFYLKPRTTDSILNSHKNSLSLSVLEIFNATLAGCYERLFSEKHSLGTYLSIYIHGRNVASFGSENDYYPSYQGFKFAPDYRFYPIKNNRILFVEAKLQLGYIYFSKLPYHYIGYHYPIQNIKYSLWTGGFGASVGAKFHASKVILTLVLGYQYFPIKVPETANYELNDGTILTMPTDTYCWYQGGPGCPFVFKVLIGGAF